MPYNLRELVSLFLVIFSAPIALICGYLCGQEEQKPTNQRQPLKQILPLST